MKIVQQVGLISKLCRLFSALRMKNGRKEVKICAFNVK